MPETPSPCVNICELDQTGEYCLGCGRSLDEIAAWGDASDDRRKKILEMLPARLRQLAEAGKS